MTRSKITAIALFVSLGVNVFLLGVFTARMLAPPHHSAVPRGPLPHETHADHHAPHFDQNRLHQAAAKGKPEHKEGDSNSHDLKMLRQMIQVMGGRKDPRVREFWENTHEDGKNSKKALRDAREHVHKTLLAEPYVRADLEQALAELGKQTSNAQNHVQQALVTLAGQLTDEERAQLRDLPQPGRRGDRK